MKSATFYEERNCCVALCGCVGQVQGEYPSLTRARLWLLWFINTIEVELYDCSQPFSAHLE